MFPEILRHPANCRLTTHAENVAKKKGRYIDDNLLAIEELFDNIKKYSGKPWKEHDMVSYSFTIFIEIILKSIDVFLYGTSFNILYNKNNTKYFHTSQLFFVEISNAIKGILR